MDEHSQQITSETFKEFMHGLLTHCKEPSVSNADIYHAIYEAAFIMYATLRQLGYQEGIEIFERLCMTPKPEKSQNLVTFLN